jgi:hypothetical protein
MLLRNYTSFPDCSKEWLELIILPSMSLRRSTSLLSRPPHLSPFSSTGSITDTLFIRFLRILLERGAPLTTMLEGLAGGAESSASI